MGYVEDFLGLKCAGDVLNAVHPVNALSKEISEAMAIRKELKTMVLRKPMAYKVLDLCAGNGLTGILAVFSLPIEKVAAIDIRERRREGFRTVKRWFYHQNDIMRPNFSVLNFKPHDTILVSSHACKDLAARIVQLFNAEEYRGLILMPCCVGQTKVGYSLLRGKLNKYDLWSVQLADAVKRADVRLFKDQKVLSPCNNIITAWRTFKE